MRRGCRPRTPAIAQAPLGFEVRKRLRRTMKRRARGGGQPHRRRFPPPPAAPPTSFPRPHSSPPGEGQATGRKRATAPQSDRLRLPEDAALSSAEGELGAGERWVERWVGGVPQEARAPVAVSLGPP